MTLTGYLAAPFLDVYAPGTFLYPLGSGTLGYAWPAAIGAKVARPDAQVLAVHGDGGVLYNVLELLSARQHRIAAKLLVVDDGGYGILRVYQEGAYGRTSKVDLAQPDFPALARSLGVPAFEARPRALAGALAEALADRRAGLHPPAADGGLPESDPLMDLALTPELVEIQQRSRRFLRRAPAARRAAVRARGRPSPRDARPHQPGRHRCPAARREHAARVGRPGLHVARAGDLRRSSSDARRTRSGTSSGGPPTCCATATTSSASATSCPRSRARRRYAYAVTEPGARVGREQAADARAAHDRAAGASMARSGS